MARIFFKIANVMESKGFVAPILKELAAVIWLSHNAKPLQCRTMEETSAELSYR